ncbi:ABC transporter ATP-binding protein [Burkholderia perseverans]|uniref:ABC transporter ATP-binding protein n=1 Tax=Burkholderia perseverans TaxID=2615214 RepID=UPI001FF07A24|nr:ABC transporter ATP-binding protein [Burkholderia perseverans]
MTPPLRQILRPFLPPLSIAIGLQALAGIASMLPWVALGQIAGRWQVHAGAERGVAGWLGAAVVASVAWMLGQTLAQHLTHRVDADLGARLRRQLADHMQRLPLGWFVRMGSDRAARYVDQDVRSLHQLVAHAPTDLTRLIVVPLAASIWLVRLDAILFTWTLVPLLAAVGIFHWLRSARYAPVFAQRNAALERLMGDYAELAQHPVLVRQYPAAGIEAAALDAVARFERAFVTWVGRIGGWSALTQVLLGTPFLLAWVICGAVWFARGPLAVAPLATFVLLVWAIAAPARALGHGADALREAQAAAQRLVELFALPALPEGRSAQAPRDASIELTGVTVSIDGATVLAEIDACIEAGVTTAIVGPSGAGKSTLLMLLARFMDPDSGSIRLGGVELRALPDEVLHAQVAVVFQHAVALDLSLAANIALHRPQAPLDAIRAVARLACIDARIAALPHGYDSVYGRDVTFSGGELQRLAIARAMLSPSPLLLVDESMSALDPQTERALHNALCEDGRTRVIVSHSLVPIRHAAQILVMDRGRIVERGSHASLLAARGLYAQLWAQRGAAAGEDAP